MQTYFENLQGMLADAKELREMAIQKRDVVKARFYEERIVKHQAEIERFDEFSRRAQA